MSNVLYGWHLDVSLGWYILCCAIASFLVRLFTSALKVPDTWKGAHLRGEAKPEDLEKKIKDDPYANMSFLKLLLIHLLPFWNHENLFGDYLLPFFVGFAEAACYPVLLKTGMIEVIGGWLAIKAAGLWRNWGGSRIAFNRFLVANLVLLAFSYFYLAKFIILPQGSRN